MNVVLYFLSTYSFYVLQSIETIGISAALQSAIISDNEYKNQKMQVINTIAMYMDI